MKQFHEGNAPSQVFARFLNAGKLAFQYCPACSTAIFYPRVLCPSCGETALEWRESSGRGTVYSTTTVYGRHEAPYNVALINLEEGFRMMSRVEGLPPEDVHIGMTVRLHVHSAAGEGKAIAVFVPEEHE